jgi:hypothetical protein
MKIILCIFGTIPRSIKYTYESIDNKIIKPLINAKYQTEIYGFNLKLDDGTIVDNATIDNSNINCVSFTHYEELNQTIVDVSLEQIKKTGKIRFMASYNEIATQNALRQLYSEYRVGLFLENRGSAYDVAIVLGPDYWFANQICINDVQNAFQHDFIYLSDVNPGYGLTNGFYIGKPRLLVPLLKRFQNIDRYFPCAGDYESLVAKCINECNIPYKLTNIVFFKVRANKIVHWQGFFRTHMLTADETKNVFKEFYALELRGFTLHYYAGLTPDILRKKTCC